MPLYRGFNAAGRNLVSSSLQTDDLDAPTNLAATATSDTEISLVWDWFDGASSFAVDISEDELEWTPLETALEATTLAVDTLTAETEYFFRVKATTVSGESEYATDSATTEAA